MVDSKVFNHSIQFRMHGIWKAISEGVVKAGSLITSKEYQDEHLNYHGMGGTSHIAEKSV